MPSKATFGTPFVSVRRIGIMFGPAPLVRATREVPRWSGENEGCTAEFAVIELPFFPFQLRLDSRVRDRKFRTNQATVFPKNLRRTPRALTSRANFSADRR